MKVRNFLLPRAFHIVTCLIALAEAIAPQSFVLAQESSKAASSNILISREDRLKVFAKLWDRVNDEYLYPEFNGVNWAQVKETYRPQVERAKNKMQLYDVLQNMLDGLHSSHLEFYLDVDFGTGFWIRPGPKQNPIRVEGRWVVRSLKDGSGAQLAGVQRGWILTHWNGEAYGADSKTTCDPDENVHLRFIDLQGQERNLDVACRIYPWASTPNSPERSTQTLDGGAIYLRFTEFQQGTYEWLDDQVAGNRSAPAIIIDLRHNGGGKFEVVQQCFKPFFSEPTVFGDVRNRDGKISTTLKVPGSGKGAYRGRVFVLIDEASASGAEVFAAGLQESGRAIVIGRQSMGAVLNAKEYKLPNGFTVDIPHSEYRTVRGVRLEGRGVIPDEQVPLTMKDFLENRDADLERVRELLQK